MIKTDFSFDADALRQWYRNERDKRLEAHLLGRGKAVRHDDAKGSRHRRWQIEPATEHRAVVDSEFSILSIHGPDLL